MKIIVDENIIYGQEAFSLFGEVVLMNGRNISGEAIKDADALIVRSITPVGEKLLDNSKVKFVGTATIGTDHINLEYLKSRGIAFSSAKGCNSYAVVEYVMSAISLLFHQKRSKFNQNILGIVGVGNIGSKVAMLGGALGFKVLRNDPPLQRESDSNIYCSLDEIFESDVITLHVPLNKSGIDRTFHLLNKDNLGKIKNDAVLINTSRGPVINNADLKEKLKQQKDFISVLDVWENEPNIDHELLELVKIGTAHIAGYSYEGKLTGTRMIYEALCRHLNVAPEWEPPVLSLPNNELEINENCSGEDNLYNIFSKSYPIDKDDHQLRNILKQKDGNAHFYFDLIRKNYSPRRELVNYKIKNKITDDNWLRVLKILRINY